MLKREGISKNKGLIITTFLMICTYILGILYFHKKTMGGIIFNSPRITAIIIIIMIIMSFIILFIIWNREKLKLEQMFVIISISVGLMFTVIVPIFQVADEVVHSYRAYDLAKGRIFYERHENAMILPNSIDEYYNLSETVRIAFHTEEKVNKDKFIDMITLPLNKNDVSKYGADPTSAYTPIAYTPQSIGILIGDLLNLPIHFVLLLGRISNLIIWSIIGYFTLKLMPIKKELMMCIMLMPMTINQASSLSPDAILNASSFMLVAFIMNLKFKKREVNFKDILLVLIATIGIVSVKMPYICISALLLTIPYKKFYKNIDMKFFNKLKSILTFLVIILICGSIFVGWSRVSTPRNQSLSHMDSVNESEVLQEEDSFGYVDTIKYIANNPIEFSKYVRNTIEIKGEFYKEGFIGILGWLDTFMPEYLISLITCILLFLIVNGGETVSFRIWDRVVCWGIGIGLFIILCVVSLSWYEPSGIKENGYFIGLQGRYFIPFAMPFFIGFYQSKFKINLNKNRWLVPSVMLFVLCFCLNVVIMRYWV